MTAVVPVTDQSLLDAEARVAAASRAVVARQKRSRWALVSPALAVIGVFGIGPLLIVLIYSFLEAGEGWSGKRLYLKKIREEQDEDLLREICRRCDYSRYDVSRRHIVFFSVEKVLPLIGSGQAD